MRTSFASALLRVSLLLCALAGVATPTLAEEVIEAWRGGGFANPDSVSVNPTDGSCWVGDTGHRQVVHLAEDGTELWRGGESRISEGIHISVSANPTDGSCWFAYISVGYMFYGGEVIHLSEDGIELWRGGFEGPSSVSVNPTDGSCWVVVYANYAPGYAVHLASDGTELCRGGEFEPLAVSVNPTDGSCWVGALSGDIVHLAEDGTELWRGGNFGRPSSVSVNPTDGSCWVADEDNDEIVHLLENGAEAWGGGGFAQPMSVSVDPTDGSCWVADSYNTQVVLLAHDGAELWRGAGDSITGSVCVNPTDGSCWVAESSQVVHLVREQRLPPVADFAASPLEGAIPLRVSFIDLSQHSPVSWQWDFGDGASSTERNPVHQYTAAGHHAVSLTVTGIYGGTDTEDKDGYILVTFSDVAPDHWAFSEVMACVDAGIVQGYPDGLYRPDVTITRDQMAVYIARALSGGAVPTGPAEATFPDVPTDHWAYDEIEYAVARRVVEGYGDGTYQPSWEVTRAQMAAFVARSVVSPTGEDGLATYTPPAAATFPDVPTWYWSYKHVEYLAEHDMVSGYPDGTYRPTQYVTRDQMAVYVARAFQLPL